MAPKSMTGFARHDGSHDSASWYWEVRTVNGRGLDVRTRLPAGYDALESFAREATAHYFRRGNISISLNVQRVAGQCELRLNERALEEVGRAVTTARKLVDAKPPRLDGLLAIKGVFEVVEAEDDEERRQARLEAMKAGLDTALADVVAVRIAEGERLGALVLGYLEEIDRLRGEIGDLVDEQTDLITARLEAQVDKLLAASESFDRTRLHQEAMLLATKADITEEIERLGAHVEAGRALLADEGAIGRRLDFLSQEFNREANTICSKAITADVTNKGLALKAVIDQMREQVQNIE